MTRAIKRVVPLRVRRRLRHAFDDSVLGEAVSLYTSESKPLGIVDSWRVARLARGSAKKSGLVRIRPRQLDGAGVLLRRGTSDAGVAIQTFVYGLHVLPFPLDSPRVVWDLGSNIGLTVASYACLYPKARIVGVEPDPENVALAERNIRRWRNRCTLVECAVWDEDGEVPFELHRGAELAGRVVERAGRHVRACSPSTLFEEETDVDLLKIDIEGAEQRVLRHGTAWATKVRNIIVEVHEPYTVEACMSDLRQLGFTAAINPRFSASIVGTKSR